MHICVCLRICIYIYTDVCMCICVYILMFIYVHVDNYLLFNIRLKDVSLLRALISFPKEGWIPDTCQKFGDLVRARVVDICMP